MASAEKPVFEPSGDSDRDPLSGTREFLEDSGSEDEYSHLNRGAASRIEDDYTGEETVIVPVPGLFGAGKSEWREDKKEEWEKYSDVYVADIFEGHENIEDIDIWKYGEEVAEAVEYVDESLEPGKLMIDGDFYGGLAARAAVEGGSYEMERADIDRIDDLVDVVYTTGTPHQGSNWAKFAEIYNELSELNKAVNGFGEILENFNPAKIDKDAIDSINNDIEGLNKEFASDIKDVKYVNLYSDGDTLVSGRNAELPETVKNNKRIEVEEKALEGSNISNMSGELMEESANAIENSVKAFGNFMTFNPGKAMENTINILNSSIDATGDIYSLDHFTIFSRQDYWDKKTQEADLEPREIEETDHTGIPVMIGGISDMLTPVSDSPIDEIDTSQLSKTGQHATESTISGLRNAFVNPIMDELER